VLWSAWVHPHLLLVVLLMLVHGEGALLLHVVHVAMPQLGLAAHTTAAIPRPLLRGARPVFRGAQAHTVRYGYRVCFVVLISCDTSLQAMLGYRADTCSLLLPS
jgi:hypothetical protein